MTNHRATRTAPLLEDLPLLPGQCEALAEAGFETSQALLRHPLVQQALLRLLGGTDDGFDPEVLSLPLPCFLQGPGVAALQGSGCRTLGDLLHIGSAQMDDLAEVRWQPEALLASLGVPTGTRGPTQDLPIEALNISSRALRACRQLGVASVADFLARERKEFLSLPGVGRKTYEQLFQAAQKRPTAPRMTKEARPGLETPLVQLVQSRRARKAFVELGLETVGDFFQTPRARFLELRNFGERTWFEVLARLQSALGGAPVVPQACPPSLLALPLERLPLPRRVREHLAALGLSTVRDLFRMPRGLLDSRPNFGVLSWKELVDSLDQAVRMGLDRFLGPSSEELTGLRDLTEVLLKPVANQRARFVLEARIGLDGAVPLTLRELGNRLGLSRERVRQLASEACAEVRRVAGSSLQRLLEEAMEALGQQGGLLTLNSLARLPLAHGKGRPRARAQTVRGLLLLFFPGQFRRLTTGALTTADPEQVRRLQRAMEGLLARGGPSIAEESLDPVLEQVGLKPESFRGLALHLAQVRFGLERVPQEQGGPGRLTRPAGVAERLQAILVEQGHALSLEDLTLLYRCRHGTAGRARLRKAMKPNSGFYRVGSGVYDLAERWPVEPETARAWKDEARARLFAARRPLPSERLVPNSDPYLLAEVLRTDPTLRDLGRLLFTLTESGQERPSWVEALIHGQLETRGEPMEVEELTQIVGPEEATLREFLQESRSLARFPDGRIGLVEWHPFGPAARTGAMEAAQLYLERHNGYTRLSQLLRGLESHISPHPSIAVLRDALTRDGRFELFGREWVSLARAQTTHWIQARALSALREEGRPLSLPMLLATRPELTEFEDAIPELLLHDPAVSILQDGTYATPR